ncbi:MAG: hypothetical protein C4318_06055 [Acidimicrobiia bacterium]
MAGDSFEFLDDKVFKRIGDLIEHATGISFDEKKREILRLHLKERAIATGCSSFSDYLALLESPSGAKEMEELSNRIVVHQTEFFRNRPQFEALEKLVLPELLAEAAGTGRTLKVWSAGCSSGEEPYSIAMVVAKVLGSGLGAWNVEIVGTDISGPILSRAIQARYPAKAARTVPEPYKSLYLRETSDGGFEVAEEIKALVSFKVHNLVKEEPPAEVLPGAQLVFCRNVTIYFSQGSLLRAISNMEAALRPGGYLFLGHSESLLGVDHCFELVDLAATFAYRKPKSPQAVPQALQRAIKRTRESGAGAQQESAGRPPPSGIRPGMSRSAAPPLHPMRGSDELAEVGLSTPVGQEFNSERHVSSLRSEDEARVKEVVAAVQGRLEKGDPRGALSLVEKEIARTPTNAALHFLHGSALHVLGEDGAAAAAFGKSIYCDARFSLAYFYRAILHEDQGNLKAATRDYAAAMRLLEADSPGKWDPYLEAMDHSQLVEVCRQKLVKLARVSEEVR